VATARVLLFVLCIPKIQAPRWRIAKHGLRFRQRHQLRKQRVPLGRCYRRCVRVRQHRKQDGASEILGVRKVYSNTSHNIHVSCLVR